MYNDKDQEKRNKEKIEPPLFSGTPLLPSSSLSAFVTCKRNERMNRLDSPFSE
jgi:hypothetical protein